MMQHYLYFTILLKFKWQLALLDYGVVSTRSDTLWSLWQNNPPFTNDSFFDLKKIQRDQNNKVAQDRFVCVCVEWLGHGC